MKLINYSLDSTDEEWFLEWLNDAYSLDLIEEVIPSRKSFVLNDSLSLDYTYNSITKTNRTSNKKAKKTFIKERIYTPDFIFKFKEFNNLTLDLKKKKYNTKPLTDLLVSKDGFVYIDIKGAFSQTHNSSITFGDRQAIMWNNYGIYVNKVIYHKKKGSCLFKDTFCPSKFIKEMNYVRGENKGKTKIPYKIITAEEFKLKLR